MKSIPFVIEKTYDVPVERVWKAITDKNEMKDWYFKIEAFEPVKGFKFSFLGGPPDGKQYNHLCEVTEVIPGKKLTYSWRYEGYEGISFVTFALTPVGTKTKLTLTHTGLETFPASNKDLVRSNFEAGWTEIVGKLLAEFLMRE